jgi:hypothetical protein
MYRREVVTIMRPGIGIAISTIEGTVAAALLYCWGIESTAFYGILYVYFYATSTLVTSRKQE